MSEWFGTTWHTVGFVALTTITMYVSLIVSVRVAGRRSVSQLSAFDAVVTIALGSMFGTTILSSDTSYLKGMTAVITLLLAQVCLGALRRRFDAVRRVVDYQPVTLIAGSEVQERPGLLGAQVTQDELISALRVHGIFDPSLVEEAILEANGEISARRRSGVDRLPEDD